MNMCKCVDCGNENAHGTSDNELECLITEEEEDT